MPSPNITKPLIGLQNWVANQVKEDPILEKRIKLPFGTDAMRGTGTQKKKIKGDFDMGSQLFKKFIKKAILERQPGPPPREGLRWKPQTHRWIRPKEQLGSEDFPGQSLLREGKDLRESFVTSMSDSIMDHIMNQYGPDDMDEDTGLPHDWDLQDVRNFVDDVDNVDTRNIFEDLGGDVGKLVENTNAEDAFWKIHDDAVNEVVEGFKSGQTSTGGGKYNPETVEQQRPKLQQNEIMESDPGEKNISTDPDFADGKYEKWVAGQSLDELFDVHGDDVMWEMEGSRRDPKAWVDERVELIVSRGSDVSPKLIRNEIEEKFYENLVEYNVDSGDFDDTFDEDEE